MNGNRLSNQVESVSPEPTDEEKKLDSIRKELMREYILQKPQNVSVGVAS